MDETEMLKLGDALNEYLKQPKTFILDPQRSKEFDCAINIARELFPKANVESAEDPLQMGAKILRIADYDIEVCGEREMKMFRDMCTLADNFEIYPTKDDKLQFAAVFNGVYNRI